VPVPADGRATLEFPSLDVPYGSAAARSASTRPTPFPTTTATVFAVERSDPQRVLFIHATTDTRSPRYFGDALGSAAESAFRAAIGLGRAGREPFAVESTASSFSRTCSVCRRRSRPACSGYVKDGGSVLIALGTATGRRGRVPILGATIQGVHDYPRESFRRPPISSCRSGKPIDRTRRSARSGASPT